MHFITLKQISPTEHKNLITNEDHKYSYFDTCTPKHVQRTLGKLDTLCLRNDNIPSLAKLHLMVQHTLILLQKNHIIMFLQYNVEPFVNLSNNICLNRYYVLSSN